MFYDIDSCDIASYADDNTPYTSEEEVIQKLELIINNLFEWFKNNHMKGNADKCHLLVTRDFDVKNSREEKLLGVKIDTKFSFENHASSLCKKASQKLHALTRVLNFVGFLKSKNLITICVLKVVILREKTSNPLIMVFYLYDI